MQLSPHNSNIKKTQEEYVNSIKIENINLNIKFNNRKASSPGVISGENTLSRFNNSLNFQ